MPRTVPLLNNGQPDGTVQLPDHPFDALGHAFVPGEKAGQTLHLVDGRFFLYCWNASGPSDSEYVRELTAEEAALWLDQNGWPVPPEVLFFLPPPEEHGRERWGRPAPPPIPPDPGPLPPERLPLINPDGQYAGSFWTNAEGVELLADYEVNPCDADLRGPDTPRSVWAQLYLLPDGRLAFCRWRDGQGKIGRIVPFAEAVTALVDDDCKPPERLLDLADVAVTRTARPTACPAVFRMGPEPAPDGTPSPLKEAFEALSRSALDADDLSRQPPDDDLDLQERLERLAGEALAARELYRSAELWLLDAADDGCAFQRVFAFIDEVRQSGHRSRNSRGGSIARPQAGVDAAALVAQARRQTARAALRMNGRPGHADAIQKAGPPVPTEVTPVNPSAARPESPEPSQSLLDQEALALALLFRHSDWSMTRIAEELRISRAKLYRMASFKKAARIVGRYTPDDCSRGRVPPGHRTADGAIEAYDDGDEVED